MKKNSLLYKINEGIHDMCYIWAKEIKSVVQDEGVLIFFIIVPILYPLIYSWAYNNEVVREVPTAVIDNSNSSMSRTFIRHFDASPNTKVAYRCNDLQEARDLVEKQIVHGILYFPEDFATRLNRMEQATVSVYCDMALMLNYKAIFQTATAVQGEMNKDIQISLSGNYTDRDEQISTQPLAFEEVPLFNSTGGYGNFIIPGVLILILQQTLLLGIGLAAGTARENNRYRDLVPVSKHYNGLFRIVFGKALCYLMLYMVISAYVILVIPRLFHYTALARGTDLIGLMFPFLLACIFFGMFVSCVIRYRENVILLVVFTSLPLLFMSGASWPQSNIPGVWQGISWLFPSTWAVRGFIRMNSMGATLHEIQLEYQMLWLQVIVYFFAACLVYRYQIIHTRRRAIERLNYMQERAQK
ncbi:MAG: ABC transporter permease, partial [Prevotella sp.]|nr:ABC transporter permease [Prevotella sp.]